MEGKGCLLVPYFKPVRDVFDLPKGIAQLPEKLAA